MSIDTDGSVLVPTQVVEWPRDAAVTFLIFERTWTDDDGQIRTGKGVRMSPEVANAPLHQRITLAERAIDAMNVQLDTLKAERARQAGESH